MSKTNFTDLNVSMAMALEQGAHVNLSGFVKRPVDIPKELIELLM